MTDCASLAEAPDRHATPILWAGVSSAWSNLCRLYRGHDRLDRAPRRVMRPAAAPADCRGYFAGRVHKERGLPARGYRAATRRRTNGP
jgi:hypothetical protein